MTPSYFNISCDSFKQRVFTGFTRLQEQQEFVDLTLAADGHIVKVHKNIMALSSPYIKELLKSTRDNAVLFLHDVKHNVLNYLLEYIYQGEVNIPKESIASFLALAQSLHISGMSKPNTSEVPATVTVQGSSNSGFRIEDQLQPRDSVTKTVKPHADNASGHHIAAHISINNEHNVQIRQFENELPKVEIENNLSNQLNTCSQIATIEDMTNTNISAAAVNNYNNCLGNIVLYNPSGSTTQAFNYKESLENVKNIPLNMEVDMSESQSNLTTIITEKQTTQLQTINIEQKTEDSEQAVLIDLNKPINLDKEYKDALKKITQYTISERGAVQIIVNRYIYYSHHNSMGGRKHRWRCVDYRRNRCQAFIDSIDDSIRLRQGAHNHPYHDDRIYKKHDKGEIFHTYIQAQDAVTLPSNRSEINPDSPEFENLIKFKNSA